VRFVATMFLWVVTTALLAVAVPTMWIQRNVVSEDGYAALAGASAHDPRLQRAMASELTTQIIEFAAANGYRTLNRDLVSGVVTSYTGNDGFPGQFAQANRIAHRWMFTDSVQAEDGSDGRWLVDIAPMLNDPSIKETLGDLDLDVPQTLTVPIGVPESSALRPGQLRWLSTWGPWVSVGSTILAGLSALFMLASARSRGKALVALGVSAFLVGAAGWSALEVTQRYVDNALNQTAGDIREVADVMVGQADMSMHHWLNLTLAAGGVLVVFGIAVSLLGGLRRRESS